MIKISDMSWLDQKVSLYSHATDNIGKPTTLRCILFTNFARDIETIIQLRKLDPDHSDYQKKKNFLKQQLQGYTCAAVMKCRRNSEDNIIQRTNVMCLDFDSIPEAMLEIRKKWLFSIPCVGFVGKSVSGKGLYVLIVIDEPQKLKQYAEYSFIEFEKSGFKADTSKGRNPNDLRFVSYDSNMLYREDPIPLHIANFNTPTVPLNPVKLISTRSGNNDGTSRNRIIAYSTRQIEAARVGNRFQTVQRISFWLGGHGFGLEEIITAIQNNNQFLGVESKYIQAAEACFRDGKKKPLAA